MAVLRFFGFAAWEERDVLQHCGILSPCHAYGPAATCCCELFADTFRSDGFHHCIILLAITSGGRRWPASIAMIPDGFAQAAARVVTKGHTCITDCIASTKPEYCKLASAEPSPNIPTHLASIYAVDLECLADLTRRCSLARPLVSTMARLFTTKGPIGIE